MLFESCSLVRIFFPGPNSLVRNVDTVHLSERSRLFKDASTCRTVAQPRSGIRDRKHRHVYRVPRAESLESLCPTPWNYLLRREWPRIKKTWRHDKETARCRVDITTACVSGTEEEREHCSNSMHGTSRWTVDCCTCNDCDGFLGTRVPHIEASVNASEDCVSIILTIFRTQERHPCISPLRKLFHPNMCSALVFYCLWFVLHDFQIPNLCTVRQLYIFALMYLYCRGNKK